MVEPAELNPQELDRLEDALELLEVADVDDPSPVVRQRLGEFREILRLSRSALPMVDVPGGVLERVMLEARQAAEVPAVTPHVEAPPQAERPGFWARLRRFALVPGVALVGAAAMVLIIVERSPEDAVGSSRGPTVDAPPVIAEEKVAANSETAAPQQFSTPAAAEPASPPVTSTPAPGGAAGGVPGAAPTTAVTDAPAEPAPMPEPKAAEQRGDEDLAEKSVAPAKEEAADKGGTPRWDIIARGDRARQKDDCNTARTEYKLALGDADARVRARAHAGLGLCSASDDDWSAAESAYKAARELDPESTGASDAERPRGTGSTVPKAAKKSTSKAKAAPVQNADDTRE